MIYMAVDIALIDTNILIYAYDLSCPEKRDPCMHIIEDCWLGKKTCALSVQNLSEFYNAVTCKIANPLEKKEARKIVSRLAAYPNFLMLAFDQETVLDAIDIDIRFGVHYWDALLVATMSKHGIFRIYTENVKDFQKVPFLEVMNPMID